MWSRISETLNLTGFVHTAKMIWLFLPELCSPKLHIFSDNSKMLSQSVNDTFGFDSLFYPG